MQNCIFSLSTQTEDMNIECESYKGTGYSLHISRLWQKNTGKMAFNEECGDNSPL